MNARMYKEVLQRHLRRSMERTGTRIFMQDGAPCHKARTIMTWLDESGVPVLDWVGQSCDQNPIENLWTRLKRIIATYPAASNLQKLAKNIKKAQDALYERCEANGKAALGEYLGSGKAGAAGESLYVKSYAY